MNQGFCEMSEHYRLLHKFATNMSTYIINIKFEWVWASLGTRPEWCARACHLVSWEIEQKLLDLIDVILLKLIPRPGDTVFKCAGPVCCKYLCNCGHCLKLK